MSKSNERASFGLRKLMESEEVKLGLFWSNIKDLELPEIKESLTGDIRVLLFTPTDDITMRHIIVGGNRVHIFNEATHFCIISEPPAFDVTN